jgi:MYXO-CTERM domain-containing protein
MERHKSYVLSRLHHRYDAKGLPSDVEFKTAAPAEGGIALPQGQKGEMVTDVKVGAESNRLQSRFVNLHPDKAVIKCENPERYRWGKPPLSYRGARKVWTAQQLATRDRTKFKPAELVLNAYPALGLPGSLSADDKAKAEAAKGAAATEDEKKEGGCSVGRHQSPTLLLTALLVGVGLFTRRRR